MKRIISLVIVLLLICGMPVTAFAMDDNPEGKTVTEIPADESMDHNYGTVDTNNGDVLGNRGTVDTNNGTVEYNNGTVKVNENIGEVDYNYGTVDINNGIVYNNGDFDDNANAKVHTNNGTVDVNMGTIETNNGDVKYNDGTVKTNEITGNVTNYTDGTVKTNYGTETRKKYNEEDMTYYGVQVDGSLLQKEAGVELNLAEKFSKAGYVLAGYIMNWKMDDDLGLVSMETPKKTDDYIYSLDHPNVLTLIWMAIAGPDGDKENGSSESGALDEKTEYFGPGCYISLNGKQYILTEIKGEDYYLASCEEYTQEELAEAGELLASLLTEEQLGHVTGEAGTLEGELNELFFGGGSRIVFPCDIGMIFH